MIDERQERMVLESDRTDTLSEEEEEDEVDADEKGSEVPSSSSELSQRLRKSHRETQHRSTRNKENQCVGGVEESKENHHHNPLQPLRSKF